MGVRNIEPKHGLIIRALPLSQGEASRQVHVVVCMNTLFTKTLCTIQKPMCAGFLRTQPVLRTDRERVGAFVSFKGLAFCHESLLRGLSTARFAIFAAVAESLDIHAVPKTFRGAKGCFRLGCETTGCTRVLFFTQLRRETLRAFDTSCATFPGTAVEYGYHVVFGTAYEETRSLPS